MAGKRRSDIIEKNQDKGKKPASNIVKKKKVPCRPRNPNAGVTIRDGYEQVSLHDMERSRGLRDESSSGESENENFARAHHRFEPSQGEPSTSTIGVAAAEAVADDNDVTTMSENPRRGRGYAQPPSPPKDGVRKKILMYNGTLLGNDDSEFPGFFRTSMRNRMEGFYKTWSDVPQETKQRIWEDFLVVYDCGEYDPSTVYKKFMEQNAEKFRKFLADIKRRVMKNCKTVEDLRDAPKPPEMPTDAIWRKYTNHWTSEDQKARSEQNKKNRAKNAGKSHGFGRKGPAARLLERMKAGKPPSMLAIIKEVNAKKDKHGNPTGEFHSVSVNEATVEYEEVHKRVRPEQVPTEVVMDMSMWGETRSNAERKRNGRMLGFGTCRQARNLTDVHQDPFRQNSVLQTQLDEMRQDMEARVRTEQEARVRTEEEALRRLQEEQDRRTELETFMKNMVQALQAVPGFVMPLIPSFPSFTSQQVPPRQPSPPENVDHDEVPQTQDCPPRPTPN